VRQAAPVAAPVKRDRDDEPPASEASIGPKTPKGPVSPQITINPLVVNASRRRSKRHNEGRVTHYGYRYYDPVTGRWPSRDPLHEVGSQSTFRLANTRRFPSDWDLGLSYVFVRNSPLKNIDYLGMATVVIPGVGTIPSTVDIEDPNNIPWSLKVRLMGQDLDVKPGKVKVNEEMVMAAIRALPPLEIPGSNGETIQGLAEGLIDLKNDLEKNQPLVAGCLYALYLVADYELTGDATIKHGVDLPLWNGKLEGTYVFKEGGEDK